MENAGTAVAEFSARQYPHAARILVLAGKGNNGGDGLVAARILAALGRQVTVALLGQETDLKGEAAAALYRLKPTSADLRIVTDEAALDALGLASQVQPPFDLILDAVLGTGFKPPLRGLAAVVRDRLNALPATPIVAVDLPTGWDADSTSQTAPDAFPANAVVTFTAPKLAHVFGYLTPRQPFGPVVVAGIGSRPSSPRPTSPGAAPPRSSPKRRATSTPTRASSATSSL